jgi:hypothetical protein
MSQSFSTTIPESPLEIGKQRVTPARGQAVSLPCGVSAPGPYLITIQLDASLLLTTCCRTSQWSRVMNMSSRGLVDKAQETYADAMSHVAQSLIESASFGAVYQHDTAGTTLLNCHGQYYR